MGKALALLVHSALPARIHLLNAVAHKTKTDGTVKLPDGKFATMNKSSTNYMRVPKEAGDGYAVMIDVFHQLHCLVRLQSPRISVRGQLANTMTGRTQFDSIPGETTMCRRAYRTRSRGRKLALGCTSITASKRSVWS